jgi:signal-transduction protein with cAMP-binding, CBS, and nucleotidyltransferase domain
MTLFSDQDNAIVFETPDTADLKSVRRYFLHLAENVCAKLDQAGYRYCEGLIMASNHQWCLSQEEWNSNFGQWIQYATPKSILELNVFFDIRSTYGDQRLVNAIQDHIQVLLKQHPDFMSVYAKNCLAHKVPVTLTKQIKTERQQGQLTLNLKECLRPMEIFCRLYALKHDIRESNTVYRLKQLATKHEIDALALREMLYVFDHIWQLRFMNQIIEYSDLRKINDQIVLQDLTPIEQQHLQSVLNRIAIFHQKVQQDFLK